MLNFVLDIFKVNSQNIRKVSHDIVPVYFLFTLNIFSIILRRIEGLVEHLR